VKYIIIRSEMKSTFKYLTVLFILILILSISWKRASVSDKQNRAVNSVQMPVSSECSIFVIKNSDRDSLKKILPEANNYFSSEMPSGISSGWCQIMDLVACDYIDAGDISLSSDTDYIYVTYKTSGGWSIGEIHLYLGGKENIPVNIAGIPQPGLFTVRETFSPEAETVVLRIARSDNTADYPVILAHAIVSRSGQSGETAWGRGNKTFREYFDVNRWGYLTDNFLH
jgi:hypothetical protein